MSQSDALKLGDSAFHLIKARLLFLETGRPEEQWQKALEYTKFIASDRAQAEMILKAGGWKP